MATEHSGYYIQSRVHKWKYILRTMAITLVNRSHKISCQIIDVHGTVALHYCRHVLVGDNCVHA